jgi:hypothetical protein
LTGKYDTTTGAPDDFDFDLFLGLSEEHFRTSPDTRDGEMQKKQLRKAEKRAMSFPLSIYVGGLEVVDVERCRSLWVCLAEES